MKRWFGISLVGILFFALLTLLWSDDQSKSGLAIYCIPTPFITQSGMRVVEVRVFNSGEAVPAKLEVEVAGKKVEQRVNLKSSGLKDPQIFDVEISEVAKSVELTATIIPDKGEEASTSVDISPARKMEIYLMMGAHTDVGYTHRQARVAERHCANLERALEFCDATDDWHEGLQFRFTAESAWQVDNFLATHEPYEIEELVKRMKQGRIEMNALYLNTLTGMTSPESLIHLRYFSKNFDHKYGVSSPVAFQTDVPGYTWGLASVLANSGVKYFCCGLNPDGSGLHTNSMPSPPFYWVGIDGSKILVWFTMRYGFRSYNGLGETIDTTKQFLIEILNGRYNEEKFPYEMIMLHTIFGDNELIDFRCMQIFKEWSEKYCYPKIIVSTPVEFMTKLEKRYGDKIPTYRGDWGTYWEDGIASTARRTAQHMRNQADADTAERMTVFASLVSENYQYPQDDLNELRKNLVLFNEHTWGSAHSISQPDLEDQQDQWNVKAGYVEKSRQLIDKILNGASAKLTSEISTNQPAIAVWNMLSWKRTGIVEATIPREFAKKNFILEDSVTGNEIPHQSIDDAKIVFAAPQVPSCGYKLFYIKDGTPKPMSQGGGLKGENGKTIFENRFYRITIDTAKGAIASLVDKETNKELANTQSPFMLGQMIYHGEPRKMKATLTDIKIGNVLFGPVFSRVVVLGSLPNTKNASAEIVLYENVKRVDIKIAVDKIPVREKEALYFAFPFAGNLTDIKLGQTLSVITPEKDQLEGGNRDWYTVTGFVSTSGKGESIIWASPDAPLVELGDINTQKWLSHIEISQPTIFSYVMNNYWWTNYRVEQEPGKHIFNYSITDTNEDYSAVASHRFSQEVLIPLRAGVIPVAQHGKLKNPSDSFLTISNKQCALVGMKKADARNSYIVRLLNLSDDKQKPVIKGALGDFKQERVNLVEEKSDQQGTEIAPHGVINFEFSK